MMRNARWLLPLSLALLLPACNQPPADATAPAATATADVENAVESKDASAASGDETAASGFVLTMDKVDAYYATILNIAKAAQADPTMEDIGVQESGEPLEKYAARVDADPRARALLTSGGLSVLEFAQVNEGLMAGMMTAAAMESGALKAIPDGIDPQVVEFARTHKAELEAKLTSLQTDLQG